MSSPTHSETAPEISPAKPTDWKAAADAHPLFIVVSGPSGVGKDSVLNKMKELELPLHFVVTATSREPRPGEAHGVDYFFYSREKFQAMIEAGEFIEYATVYDDFKGIPKAQVQKAFATGQDVIVRVDVQGAAKIQQLYPQALLIFLTTASEQELVERLKRRRTESADQLEVRLQTVRAEMQQIKIFDYIVPNLEDQLEATVENIEAIITTEHNRVVPRQVTL